MEFTRETVAEHIARLDGRPAHPEDYLERADEVLDTHTPAYTMARVAELVAQGELLSDAHQQALDEAAENVLPGDREDSAREFLAEYDELVNRFRMRFAIDRSACRFVLKDELTGKVIRRL